MTKTRKPWAGELRAAYEAGASLRELAARTGRS